MDVGDATPAARRFIAVSSGQTATTESRLGYPATVGTVKARQAQALAVRPTLRDNAGASTSTTATTAMSFASGLGGGLSKAWAPGRALRRCRCMPWAARGHGIPLGRDASHRARASPARDRPGTGFTRPAPKGRPSAAYRNWCRGAHTRNGRWPPTRHGPTSPAPHARARRGPGRGRHAHGAASGAIRVALTRRAAARSVCQTCFRSRCRPVRVAKTGASAALRAPRHHARRACPRKAGSGTCRVRPPLPCRPARSRQQRPVASVTRQPA